MTKATHKRNHVLEILLTVLENLSMIIMAERQEDKHGTETVTKNSYLICKLQQGIRRGRRRGKEWGEREKERGRPMLV